MNCSETLQKKHQRKKDFINIKTNADNIRKERRNDRNDRRFFINDRKAKGNL